MENIPPRTADRLDSPRAIAEFEPTVTSNSFDTASFDTTSFGGIEAHVGGVYRYALRLAGRTEAAEDLTQETMLRGWKDREKRRDPRVTRVWLLRIATNLWNDELRRAKFRMATLASDPPCPRLYPAAASDGRENVQLALAAMDELPPRQRQVLYLATCEQMSNGEVASVLEISEAAVKANLSLARKEMRERLKDVYAEVCGRRTCDKT